MILIILHSGEWDKVYHAFSLASTYSALDEKVSVFLTYWALDTIVNGKFDCGSDERTEKVKKGIEKGQIKSIEEIVKLGKEFGNVEIVACSGSMEVFGFKEEDLPEWVDRVGGLAEQLMNAEKVIFI